MPKFVTIGYGDRQGYERTPQAIRDAAHIQDQRLKDGGAVLGIAGRPVQVRNAHATGVQITDGSFMAAGLPVAGFAIIEAKDLEEAISMVATVPCAVADGVVEVWPLEEPA